MLIDIRPRQSGKTTDLIKIASERGGYIVCLNHEEAKRIFRESKKLNLRINYPITFYDFIKGDYYEPGVKELYIDNAELLLQKMARATVGVPTSRVYAATLSYGPENAFIPEDVSLCSNCNQVTHTNAVGFCTKCGSNKAGNASDHVQSSFS